VVDAAVALGGSVPGRTPDEPAHDTTDNAAAVSDSAPIVRRVK
jgi:hypothetical protein